MFVNMDIFGCLKKELKSFDIYSLGVIFVELAHWKTVEEVLGINVRRKPDLVRKVREGLLQDDQIAEVGACMGEKFEEATKKCLVGEHELGLGKGDDETTDEVAGRLSNVGAAGAHRLLQNPILSQARCFMLGGPAWRPCWVRRCRYLFLDFSAAHRPPPPRFRLQLPTPRPSLFLFRMRMGGLPKLEATPL